MCAAWPKDYKDIHLSPSTYQTSTHMAKWTDTHTHTLTDSRTPATHAYQILITHLKFNHQSWLQTIPNVFQRRDLHNLGPIGLRESIGRNQIGLSLYEMQEKKTFS